MTRTEEEKVLGAPLRVMLGSTEYPVPLLCIRDAREWRHKLVSVLKRLPEYASLTVTTEQPEQFGLALGLLLQVAPDDVIDLFFAYARTLDRQSIEVEATEVELAVAMDKVLEVACPLAGSLVSAVGKLVH